MTSPVASKINGDLDEVNGSDLFGNAGSIYYHYVTDKPTSTSTDGASITLRIELLGNTFAAADADIDINLPPPSVTLATYLRYGKAAAVRKDVPFK